MNSRNIFLHASEHIFLLSSSESLMLRNYSRIKEFKYCSQIGGSESIRDIQEAKNIDADAFEFQIVESLFSMSKIIQALQKTYSDDIDQLTSKYIFINISNKESLDLLIDLENHKFPQFFNKSKIIINYDRRALIKSFYKLKNNNFEVIEYESEINQIIFDSYQKINKNKYLISISGGITLESLENLIKKSIPFDILKTGLFSIKIDQQDKYDLNNALINFQSLEVKLVQIMNNSIKNKTSYLANRKTHLTNYLVDFLN
mgnify:CR=1 FL=1